MDDYEMLASMKRRRKAIADAVTEMQVQQAHWNARHPHEKPLDALEGQDEELRVPLAELDASIAKMERRITAQGE